MARKKPPGYLPQRNARPALLSSAERREFVFALDDSGPTAPVLGRDGKFNPVAQPFTILGGVALNKKHWGDFNRQWDALRAKIQVALGCDELPALHARLMFGKLPEDRPATYRERPNPYRRATAEQVLQWYLEAMEIIGSFTKQPRGGIIFSNTFWRNESCGTWEETFSHPDAQAEAEFLKLFRRRKHPDLYRHYIAAVTSVFTIPTLDSYCLIEEILRQQKARGTLLLDPFSDAVAFDDAAAFEFLRSTLNLRRIENSRRVPDTDSEPLLQAADFVAYLYFRKTLHEHRLKQEPFRMLESFIPQAEELSAGQPLFTDDIGHRLARVKSSRLGKTVNLAARYAIAHHLLLVNKKAAPTVTEFFTTPEEFLARCHLAYKEGSPPPYLPILKDGVLERWEASGRSDTLNGEDHP